MDVTFEDIMYIGRRDFEFASYCGECKGVVTEGFYDKEISVLVTLRYLSTKLNVSASM